MTTSASQEQRSPFCRSSQIRFKLTSMPQRLHLYEEVSVSVEERMSSAA
jgi:hypothetical protein